MVSRKSNSLKHNSASSSRSSNMQAKSSSPRVNQTHDGSDTDDWTLVTPPQSKSSSPQRQASPFPEPAAGPSNARTKETLTQTEASPHPDDQDPSYKFEEVAADDGDDDDDNVQVNRVTQTSVIGRVSHIITHSTALAQPTSSKSDESNSFITKKTKPDAKQVSETAAAIKRNPMPSNSSKYRPSAPDNSASKSTQAHAHELRSTVAFNFDGWIGLTIAVTLTVSLVYCVFSLGYMLGSSLEPSGHSSSRESLRKILNSRYGATNFVYLDSSDHAFSKLKLLDDELLECIQRQNPRHEIDFNPDFTDSTARSKPIMGLVCYEKEAEWRKKFHKLKIEYNFDIWKTLKRVRNQLTNEMLDIYHPGLRFMLITNQLDWLNRLDAERRDRELERLKAEMHELRRSQIKPTKSRSEAGADGNRTARQHAAGQQPERMQATNNALVSLQGENRRLRAENEMLKQSLGEKAGTVYIKQSIELEKCERENNGLRRFHLQVAHEVSKGLKELDLQITDFGAILNEQEESLSARLNQTRGYLMHLVEETSQLAARNKSFEAELNEARLLKALVVHEAETLIESAEPSSGPDRELGIANGTEQELKTSNDAVPSELTAEQLRHLDNFRCSGNSESLATKVNWLMKRAKLREKLRKTQFKLGDTEAESELRRACYTKNSGRHNGQKLWKRQHKHDRALPSRETSCDYTY